MGPARDVATVVALALGLPAGNLVKPGEGFSGSPSKDAAATPRRASPRQGDRIYLTLGLQALGGTFFSAESIAVGIALVVGIDRMMSEGRALTNCIGNGAATMVIAAGTASTTRSASARCSRSRRWPTRTLRLWRRSRPRPGPRQIPACAGRPTL